jgi:hypothetical protein
MEPINVEERARAWALIEATDPQMVADNVLELDDGDEFVVIRADVVDGGPSNIIAAIDTAKDYYDQAVAAINAINGINSLAFLKVLKYKPDPPHNASGFITTDEAERGEKKDAKPGRQDNSPGFNPWG